MSDNKDNAYDNSAFGELTLEPLEIKEERVSDDIVSRDRRQHVDVAANTADLSTPPAAPRKPMGKASFITDDRKAPERRRSDRRKSARLTGDRRGNLSRRAAKNPWIR